MKRAILFTVSILFNVVFSHAQESEIPSLDYGDEIYATLPRVSLEKEFIFLGNVGDIIMIEASIESDDRYSTAFYPTIALLNERGTAIARSDTENTQHIAILPIELQANGQYSILITPGEYSNVDRDAPFVLRLLKPQVLQPNSASEDTLDSEVSAYYIVIADSSFTVSVRRLGQSLLPVFAVAEIQAGSFKVHGILIGQYLSEGSLTFEPNRNTLHFVELSKPAKEFSYDPVDEVVKFEISLSQ